MTNKTPLTKGRAKPKPKPKPKTDEVKTRRTVSQDVTYRGRNRKNLTAAEATVLKHNIAKLYVDGYGVYQMQQYMRENGIIDVSVQTIYLHIDKLLAEWHRDNQENIDKQISGELMKLSRAESEYWDAWVRSKGSVNHKTVRRVGRQPRNAKPGDGSGLQTTEREETLKTIDLIGDPRFLEGYERCITKRIEILQRGGLAIGGDTSPGAVFNTMNQTVVNIGVVNPNDVRPIKTAGG